MKGNSDLLVDSVENSYILDDVLQSNKVKAASFNDFSPEVKPQKIKNDNFLNHFWKRLIFKPLSFPQNPNTDISNILEEETGTLVSGSIRSVLSKKLGLPMNSKKLSKAKEDTIKIFHEDYPCDFILEYNGERLGMMMLDKCFNSNGEAKLIYRFNPHIKSFRGIF